jgi:hypothetical protein
MPRKIHLLVVAGCAVLATVLALTGCAGRTISSSAPVPAPPTASTWLIAPSAQASGAASAAARVPGALAPASASVPTAEPDGAPPGTQTCTELGAAIKAASLMQPGVVDGVVRAATIADAPVADAAQRLATAYAAARASQGTASEPDAVAAVSAAAADMDGVCTESGLESAG